MPSRTPPRVGLVSRERGEGGVAANDRPAAAASRLSAEKLCKSFGKKQVVREVSFAMTSGEIVGFLGPNGAGKTTVFYMVVGFIRPDSGRVLLDGRDVTRLPMYRRARAGVSYLPQEASAFRKLTVEENVRAVLEIRRDLSTGERRAQLEELLEDLGIGTIRRQPAYTLSGGERRRTEIARALAISPRFLLLDEPFAGIDPIAVYEIKTIVRGLAERGIGVLLTDHNVRDTLEITHRSYIINNGSIVVEGGRDEVMESPIARQVYLGDEFRL